ncbi:hypothetical protein BDD12DRAFT_350432 [Trichophaea hybrida]|nr:hypothetical protein BDD12DRAFT_350432 [Trichophaea hybrida]
MQDLMGRTPLHFAMEQTPVHIEILKYLLQCKKININTQDFRGCTVLHLAVRRGNCALLQYLLSEEPDIELGDHQRQRSLEYAINAADPETVNLLLQNSADIRRICVEKWRSLYNATIDGKAFEEYRYYYSTHDQNSVQSMDIFDHKQYLPPPDDNTSRADPATTPAYFMWVWRPGGNKQAYEGIPSTRSVNAAAPKAAFLRCYASFQYYVGHSYQDSDVDCRSSFEMTPQRSSISWIMLKGKRRDEQTSSPGARMEILSSRIYISTLSFGWIPDHGLEFFSLFLRDLKQKWCLLFDTAENHLASTREKLLEKQGMDNNLSHNLLRDAQCWTNLRKLILAHIRKAEEFIRVYEENDYLCDEVWNYINSLTLSDDLKGLKECTERISRLDEETKEMIQLEFNLVSIHESHISVEMAKKSTIMAASMKRLSWITFIFLPLMFTSSLFGMNVDLFNNHPSWRWYAVAGIVVQVLVTAGWVVFKFTKLEEALETAIREIYCRFINAIRKTSVDLLGGAHDRLNGER